MAEGYHVIGFDIERHDYGTGGYPAQLVLQDVLTLHGRQLKDAALIVASPPCQEYSYMAMPWSRAKQIAGAFRGECDFPVDYRGSRTVCELNALFDACFRIQREAIEAAGHYIPLVVENVRGAIPWVGRSRWNYGSFHLWGDVPALMPMTKRAAKAAGHSMNRGEPKWNMHHRECVDSAIKNTGGSWFNIGSPGQKVLNRNPVHGFGCPAKEGGACGDDPMFWCMGCPKRNGIKQAGISGPRANGKGDRWFQDGAATHGSKSSARKAASAAIAKIPFPLAQHIARAWAP